MGVGRLAATTYYSDALAFVPSSSLSPINPLDCRFNVATIYHRFLATMSSRFLNISRRNQPTSRSPSPLGREEASTAELAARVQRFTLALEGDTAAHVGDDDDNQSFTTADGGGAAEVEGESFYVTCFMCGDASSRGGGSSIVELDIGTGGVFRRELNMYIDDAVITTSAGGGYGEFVDGYTFFRRYMGVLPRQIRRQPRLPMGNPGVISPSATNALVNRVANLEARGFLERLPSHVVEPRGRVPQVELLGDNNPAVSWFRDIVGRRHLENRVQMRASAEFLYRLRILNRYFVPQRDSSDLRRIYDGRHSREDAEEWEMAPIQLPGPWEGSRIIFHDAANPQEGI